MRLISTLSVLLPFAISLLKFQRNNLSFLLAFMMVLSGSVVEVYSLLFHVWLGMPYTNSHHIFHSLAELVFIGAFAINFCESNWLRITGYGIIGGLVIASLYETSFLVSNDQYFYHSFIIRSLALMLLILVGFGQFLSKVQLANYANSIFIFFIVNFFYVGFCVFQALIRDSLSPDLYKLNSTVFDLFSIINTAYNLSLALAFYFAKWER